MGALDLIRRAEDAARMITAGRQALAAIAQAVKDDRESLNERDLTKLKLLMEGEKAENEATDKALTDAIADFRSSG